MNRHTDVSIRKGLNLRVPGAPLQMIDEGLDVHSVALLGRDCPGIHPEFSVAAGDTVEAGQVLFVDRERPRIRFVAPVCGLVTKAEFGSRRTLSILTIDIDKTTQPTTGTSGIEMHSENVRNILLERGLWPALTSRPFGRIPNPDGKAAAIFVTAMDTNPLAAEPGIVIESQQYAFNRGLEALVSLTDGPVVVCQAPGSNQDVSALDQVRTVSVSGPHPAGLPGTHIHHLFRTSAQEPVWTIDYQDTIAIGHLFETGRFLAERVISLAGAGVKNPRLLRTYLGANIADIVDGELSDEPLEIISGSLLSGREAAYLGRYHAQISICRNKPVIGDISLLKRLKIGSGTSGKKPLIPTQALERALPFDILPVPLMRALSIGDAEAAKQLGCLDLIEEDVAQLSYLCSSGADYGALLRRVLDELQEAA